MGIPYGTGPFARESVPTYGRYPTAAERREVDAIGRAFGCHWCSSIQPRSRSGSFYNDHQPPTALNPPGGRQSLFPHYAASSGRQGGYINFLLRWD